MLGKKETQRRYGAQLQLNRLLSSLKDMNQIAARTAATAPGLSAQACSARLGIEAVISSLLAEGEAQVFQRGNVKVGDDVLTAGGRWLSVVSVADASVRAVDEAGRTSALPYTGVVAVSGPRADTDELFAVESLFAEHAAA